MNENEFKNPSKEYRPAPFWSWNDKLEDEELIRQVRDMKEKGFGGYFMHSRVGLITNYLSDDWMKKIKVCLTEGKKTGMESWLYDEDKWPSGFAGGIVPAMGDKYRAKGIEAQWLEEEQLSVIFKDYKTIAVFSVVFKQKDELEKMVRLLSRNDVPLPAGKLIAFKIVTDKPSNWYNGETDTDHLNPKATKAFLKCTHEAYAERFQSKFGEFMPGIFTDEPHFHGIGDFSWTKDLPQFFVRFKGYDLRNFLPLLYFKGAGYHKVRYDFNYALTKKFIKSYTLPYSKCCKKYGLKFTGHYNQEDTLLDQVMWTGAAMPHYEYMDVPGIDHLERNIREPLTLKQVTSVARQFDRKRILCEIFGVSGHSMSFEDQKWIADFHFALGVTFMNQHLTLYSMTGDRKRDYPPTFSYHQPYWKYYRHINDYFSRCAYMLSQGKPVTDILMLHPMATGWTTYTGTMQGENLLSKNRDIIHYDNELETILKTLLEGHFDFDFGDEIIIKKHAKIGKSLISIGKQKYKLIIVPPSLNWSSKTLKLLKEY
ncbi:MAG: glycosyl hydrolase, partial [Planctomycetota bacterium]